MNGRTNGNFTPYVEAGVTILQKPVYGCIFQYEAEILKMRSTMRTLSLKFGKVKQQRKYNSFINLS